LRHASSFDELQTLLNDDIENIQMQMQGDGHHKSSWKSPNRPDDYKWLAEAFEVICVNRGHITNCCCQDGSLAAPIFVLMGACPSSGMFSSPMQAVMFFAAPDGIHFWWVKPESNSPGRLEWETMSCHSSGPHKNVPGSVTSQLFNDFAGLFHSQSGEVLLGIATVQGGPRAYMEFEGQRFYFYCIWQEDISTSMAPWSSKYIKGRMAYQKDPDEMIFFLRSYQLIDGQLTLGCSEEGPFGPELLPNEAIKDYTD